MTFPTPTRKDHLRFCEVEGWDKVRSTRGKSGTHHDTFELTLPDGDVLRTRISRPPNRNDYGPSLWAHILRDQLKVTPAEFWECVGNGTPPMRDPHVDPTAIPLPTELVWALINRVGIPESEVGQMTKQDAVDRLNRFWMTGE